MPTNFLSFSKLGSESSDSEDYIYFRYTIRDQRLKIPIGALYSFVKYLVQVLQ